MSSNTDDLILTDDLIKENLDFGDGLDDDDLKKITKEDGKMVDFNFGLDLDDWKKLKDHHVMDVLTNHVNADLVTNIDLTNCRGITNATLIQISNMCPQLERLSVRGCEMITDDGIVPIAEKCGKQLKILYYSQCDQCTDAALKSVVNNCNQLKYIWAIDCGISTIPENIGYKLTKLKYLSLARNKITKIPVSLILLKDTLKDKENFDIPGNPLQEPPSEIADQGIAAIQRYFEEIPPSGIAKQGLAAIYRYFEEIRKKGHTISNTLKSRSR
jgi:Leucine-rich repeat (LRR) protein